MPKTKRKRGAPKGNQNARKQYPLTPVTTRGTADQIDKWMDAADRDGKSISAWIRWACDQMAG